MLKAVFEVSQHHARKWVWLEEKMEMETERVKEKGIKRSSLGQTRMLVKLFLLECYLESCLK